MLQRGGRQPAGYRDTARDRETWRPCYGAWRICTMGTGARAKRRGPISIWLFDSKARASGTHVLAHGRQLQQAQRVRRYFACSATVPLWLLNRVSIKVTPAFLGLEHDPLITFCHVPLFLGPHVFCVVSRLPSFYAPYASHLPRRFSQIYGAPFVHACSLHRAA